jgi:hypothetical protein
MSKTLALVIGVIMFVALWSFIFFQTSGDWRRLKRLASSGKQVTGAVTAKEPMNHASVRYDYFVDGFKYSGGPCGVHSLFDRIQVGDGIIVTYLPEAPSTSTCEDPHAGASARAGILFVVLPGFSLFASGLTTFGLYRLFRSKPPGSSNSR